MTIRAVIILFMLHLFVAPAAAAPAFSTSGPCPTNTASRVPAGAREIVLSNPSKLHLAASLYRRIDKPNFNYVDADGTERVSDFPYFYQVYIPPGGSRPVGCTKIYLVNGEAAQTFVLQATDYFFQSPTDLFEDARPYVGFVGGSATGWRVINLHPTKAIHLSIGKDGSQIRLDLPAQAVSSATVAAVARSADKAADAASRPVAADAHF